MGVRGPSSTSGPPAQGTSARKRNPQNLWLQKPMGLELVKKKLLDSLAVPLKGPMLNLLRCIPSEVQHWGSYLKGTSDIREELKFLASERELGDSFLPDRKVGGGHCAFFEPFPPSEPQNHRTGRLVLYLGLHQPG